MEKIRRAANLERAAFLHVLALENSVDAGLLIERVRRHHRCALGEAFDPLRRAFECLRTSLSVAGMFIHHVFERLAFREAGEIVEKTLDRAIAPARRMIGAMRRKQHVLQFVKRVTGGQRLHRKHIERRAANLSWTSSAAIRAASSITGPRPMLITTADDFSSRDLRGPDQPARFRCRRCRSHHEIARRQHLIDLRRSVSPIDQGSPAEFSGLRRSARILHAERLRALRDRASDFAVSDDADRLAAQFLDIEIRPNARFLLAHQAAIVVHEMQHRADRPFGQRTAKHAASIGERHRTRDNLRRQNVLDSRRKRVHPADARRQRERCSAITADP